MVDLVVDLEAAVLPKDPRGLDDEKRMGSRSRRLGRVPFPGLAWSGPSRRARLPAHQALVVRRALAVRRRHEHLAVAAHAQLVHAGQLVLDAPLPGPGDAVARAAGTAAHGVVVTAADRQTGRRRGRRTGRRRLGSLQALEEHPGRVDLNLRIEKRAGLETVP